MLDPINLAWLAGVVDAEGAVGLHISKRDCISGCIQICSTSKDAITHIAFLLKKLEVTAQSLSQETLRPLQRKPSRFLSVRKLSSILRLCQALLPYSVMKRERLELMLEFATSRLNGQREYGGKLKSKKPYTKRERELQKIITSLNAKGKKP